MNFFGKRGSLSRQRRITGWLLLVPMLLALMINYLLPFGIACIRSLYHGMGNTFVGIQNYVELLQNQTFLLAIRNLLLLWAFVLPANLCIAFLLALLCHRVRDGKLSAFFFLPAVLPAVCVVEIVSQLFGTSQMDGLFSLLPADWSEGPAAGVVFACLVLWKGLGYSILILTAALGSIPEEYLEAASLEGASYRQIVFFIRLPLVAPAMGICAILAVYNSFRCFREALLLGGSHPAESIYSLQHFLQNNFTNMNFARLEAASVFLLAVPLVFLVLFTALWKFRTRKEGGRS